MQGMRAWSAAAHPASQMQKSPIIGWSHAGVFELRRVDSSARKSLADSAACPVPDAPFPIERSDSLVSMLKDGPRKAVSADVATVATHASVDVGFIGLLLATCGVFLVIVRWFAVSGRSACAAAASDAADDSTTV